MRTANPALNNNTFDRLTSMPIDDAAGRNVMTVNGTIHCTITLLALVVVAAAWTWHLAANGDGTAAMPWMIGGIFGGLIFAFITIFKPNFAPITAPIYAALEGLFLGGLSSILNAHYPGIVIQAVALTFGVMFALLIAYRSGIIRATEKFKLGVVAATGGIFIVYMASFVLGMFGVGVPYIHGSGMVGIGFSLFVVIIASLNLILDFDLIESGAKRGAPKFMEWYGAFALLVTLVWLYIEILRLLSKLNRR